MAPSIATLSKKKLVGKRMTMSLSNDKTGELWRSFMLRRKEIGNSIGTGRYSMQVYARSYFDQFDPTAEFEKWAAVEVADFEAIPDGMETYLLPGGMYAVFQHKGMDTSIFQYIFSTWLPNSDYSLDDRPHFEILGDKYKNNGPDSEEEIWIPIRLKS